MTFEVNKNSFISQKVKRSHLHFPKKHLDIKLI